MRIFAAFLFSSAVVLAPALATAQAAAAPTSQVAQATTAPAAPVIAPAQAANESSGVNLNEIVCKSEPPATGTRLGGGRECHTVREWNDRERQAQDITRRQQVEGVHLSGP